MSDDPVLDTLSRALRAACGDGFAVQGCEPARGGCIHDAFVVRGDDTRFFVKMNSADALPMFEAEADGLAAIAASGAFRTPQVVGSGADEVHAWLILEHIDLRPLGAAGEGTRFAEALAALHQAEGPEFGWHRDNFIGSTPQQNAPEANWAHFFVNRRLRPQFELARRAGLDNAAFNQAQRMMTRVPALFLDYRPRPALLHGDLWHGNAAVDAAGTPVVFDPACHYGDRESDLAMSELFGGFPSAFYLTYRKLAPLDADYELRKPLYSLYHLLNHLNLFGRGYLREVLRLTAKLADALSSRGL